MSTTMAARPKKMIRLRSVDGKDFVLEAKAAMSSETIRGMMEDGRSPYCIPVAGVKAQTLAKVVEYWTTRPTATSKGDGKGDDGVMRRELGMWDCEEELASMDPDALFELDQAARWLLDWPLMELTGRATVIVMEQDVGLTEKRESMSSTSSTMAATAKKMIRLRSVDGKDFVVEAKAAMSSETIKGMMEDGRSPHCIPVAGVKAQTLAKVVEYWTNRPTATSKGDGVMRRELGMWDWEEELAIMDLEALFELEQAARWLLDWPLIELTGRATVMVMEQDVGLTEKRESMSSIMAARAKKMIRLRSVDGKDFVVEAKAAMSSETIKGMMEDGGSPHCIPVAGVKAQTLAKVVEYWTTRPTATSKGDGVMRRELRMWDWEEELAIMDPEALFELDQAARWLLDWPLIELTGQATVIVMEQDVGLTEKRESMSSTSSTKAARAKKMIKLRSVDGKDFVVEAKAAVSSETIKRMMEDGRSPHCIPVAGVKAQTLAKVVEYWTTRPTATSKGNGKGDDGVARRELGMWEEKFVSIDPEALFELGKAAQFLEDGTLIELTERASLMEIKY